jgi:hypothetical protein
MLRCRRRAEPPAPELDMSARLRHALPFALALSVASVAFATPAAAQDARLAPAADSAPATAQSAPPAASAITPAGPTMEAAAVAVRHAPVATAATAPRGGYGQPMALMIVGGAAVLVGLIIGGDVGTVIAVGGAVAGLVGLYQYLQ